MLDRLTQLFPLWALLFFGIALCWPSWFTPLQPSIVPLLGLVMFGMGITLTADSFREVFKRPLIILLGLALQFLLMPLLAWLISLLLGLSPWLLAGMVLVGSCPGGTASNVVCYLARGDVALSITLTTLATLLAVIATPFLVWLYAGQTVPVPIAAMLLSIIKVVLLPVLGGMLVNHFFSHRLQPIKAFFPLLSVLAIVLIIAIIAALNHARLAQLALPIALAVVLHNLSGLLGGYWLARLAGAPVAQARAISIEVGMQNSGLGVALAMQHFSPAAALPGALFSIWHNLSGSALARWWSYRDERKEGF